MTRPTPFILLASAALFAGGSVSAFAQSGAERIVLPPEERQINEVYYAIGDLLKGDWGDPAYVNEQLSARLEDRGDMPQSNARLWTSQDGHLRGLALRRIELLIAKDGAPPRALILELAEPGPDGRKLAEQFSPEAEYSPPHPGARDAPGTWKIKKRGYTLYFAHKRDSMQITGISLMRE
jgi:hypothetical protein